MNGNFPTLLISLEKDHDRRSHAIEQFALIGISPHVVPAVNGHDPVFDFKRYRHLSRGKWWDMEKFKPGAFGCSLSHADCWRIVKDSEAPFALICEDDIVIEQQAFRRLTEAELPIDFDVIFLNAGTNRFLDVAYPTECRSEGAFARMSDTLLRLVSMGKLTDQLTPGSYGYFVSRKGAGKLLNLMEREKVCMGVDYAMVFGSLSEPDMKRIMGYTLTSNYLKIYLDICSQDACEQLSMPRESLANYIWNPSPVFRHRSDFGSSLDHHKFLGFEVFS